MSHQFARTALLLGEDALERLKHVRVAVFGVGGVGGYVCEALVRSGVGAIDLIDNDKVCLSNLNRQIIATHETLGEYKVDAMKARILAINPEAEVTVHRCFFLPENAGEFSFDAYDYVVDAVDTVTAKIEIILRAQQAGTPVISCMGAGNKLDPCRFEVADIYETSVCPLARVMRRELKKRGVKSLKVVYSREEPRQPEWAQEAAGQDLQGEQPEHGARRSTPGSVAYVPSVAGLIAAGEVIRDLVSEY